MGEPAPQEQEYKNKAAPEDLKRVKSHVEEHCSGDQRQIPGGAGGGRNRNTTRRIRRTNRLFVVFADFLAESYLNSKEHKELLEQIIRDKAGCETEVTFVLAEDEGLQKGNLSSIDLEERIKEFIHTDIEIEEENLIE